MKYRLIVLTHGDAAPLHQTLESFREHVTPDPVERFLMVDAKLPETLPGIVHGWFTPEETIWSGGPHGFCSQLYTTWAAFGGEYQHVERAVPLEPVDFVFWLEHDFVFNQDVDLADLAAVLERHPELAQMALMRDAVNPQEKAAGGLYELRADQYEPVNASGPGDERMEWLEHKIYFTTNPSLMTREFMDKNLPHYDEECEGKFGLDLVTRGYRFGVWGNGEPWVTHIGHRTGFGY